MLFMQQIEILHFTFKRKCNVNIIYYLIWLKNQTSNLDFSSCYTKGLLASVVLWCTNFVSCCRKHRSIGDVIVLGKSNEVQIKCVTQLLIFSHLRKLNMLISPLARQIRRKAVSQTQPNQPIKLQRGKCEAFREINHLIKGNERQHNK